MELSLEPHGVRLEEACIPKGHFNELVQDGERIVISGISGVYPQAHNVKELANILYNKENPVTSQDSRWTFKHPELTQYSGKVPDLDRFDAQFFSVFYHLGHHMDPLSRKLLEQTYQAIYDAGLSPALLNGKKVGVFIGTSSSDTEKILFVDSATRMGILGTSKAMFANRISYWLNAKGPSIAIENTDCSSYEVLAEAFQALNRGECETAVVGSAYLSLHPHGLIHHARLGVISKDGKTKSFAENSDGYSMSDAISVLVLQKYKDALRCYAELVHVKNEFISVMSDNTGPKFGYVRDPKMSAKFIREFYKETQVMPSDVEYVEATGTGVPDADKSELEAIDEVYCKDRKYPLLVGSVTSNVGFTEATSGITAITKILLGYHTGKLAANLNSENPRKDIEALREGRIRVVNEHQSFDHNYTAVNGLSYTGVNSHVLLNGHHKAKDLTRYKSSIPHLVVLSGRQESSVKVIFDSLKSRPVDAEELALLHNAHSKNISGHLGRGFIILDTNAEQETVSLCEKVEYFDDARRPLWFVYSGMGSQWPGMGAQLMRIPIFAAAIERCQKALMPKNIDVVNIITSECKHIFDNILHSFVSIAAVQIGLTDILRELGLEPDGIIGHSVGELGCAYADGCMTAEEMMLAAYSRGLVSRQTPLIRGAMAAVGLGYDQISKMCPAAIDVACHNGPDSSTISGPADVMRDFVAELTSKGIFAKEVPCSNIAYHSRYIADAGPNLLKYLKEVIKEPKLRSKRWLSTSVPQDKWEQPTAKYCSAEYHTNNLLSPVLFEETARLIPSNAVLIEVAPHGLLQAILKRSLSSNCRQVPLTRRGHPDNSRFLLESIGKLYMEGYTPLVQALYPKVEFPVSTGTPMLSHLVEWIHTESWNIILFNYGDKIRATSCKFITSIHDDEYSFLKGHVIRGKMCYPFAAALVAAWDTFAMHIGMHKREVSMQFQDVRLYAQPLLFDQQALEISVNFNRGNGHFEILSQYSKIASGYIIGNVKNSLKFVRTCDKTDNKNSAKLTSCDIYQLLNNRGYNYINEFRSIETANKSLDEAELIWCDNNWVTLIDGMLQLNALREQHDAVSQATHIRKICIDVKEHANYLCNVNGKTFIKAEIVEEQDLTKCGGIVLQGITFRHLPPVKQELQLNLCTPNGQSPKMNGINGHLKYNDNIAEEVILQSAEIGKLRSLQWVEHKQLKKSNITVHFAGINMLDVTRAAGTTTWDSGAYGMDYSGISDSDERVMGIVRDGAASTEVRAQPGLLWPVPSHWSLEDAATVPLAYAHAYYALMIRGRLEPGLSVLVHGGTGALGQAAIAIALAHNCQVFATVSDMRKKLFLKKLFPQIKDEHIGNSRDVSFADDVLIATHGKGCNIIISCLKGASKNISLHCLSFIGVFIDTVLVQDREDFEYGLWFLTKQRSYITADFASLFKENRYEDKKAVQNMVAEGIAAGYVVPLSRVTYAPHEVIRAFRLIGARQHRGRVLIRMRGDPLAQKRISCHPRNGLVSNGMRNKRHGQNADIKHCDSESLEDAILDELSNINYNNTIKYLNLTDVVDRSIYKMNGSHIMMVNSRQEYSSPLLEQISALADVFIPKNTDPQVTLLQFGVIDGKAKSVCGYLNNNYNIWLEEEEIPSLTIDRINEIEKYVTEVVPRNCRGLTTFFSILESDVLLATVDLVELPTLCKDVISSSNDFDTSERHLCIIPGLEGHHERFRSMCKRLKLPALVLQPGLDYPRESALDMAQRYAEILMKRTEVQDHFYLLGYESGVMVALELAALLEDQGLTGTVLCIGYEPEELQDEIKEQFNDFTTEEELQNAVILHMVKLITNYDPVALENMIDRKKWTEKLDTCMIYLRDKTTYPAQYVRALLEVAFARILQVQQYNASIRTLRSKIVLLRAATDRKSTQDLHKLSQQPVIVHQLQFPLSHVLEDIQCSSIINRYLDDETQRAFKNRNLCESYRWTKGYLAQATFC